MWQLAATTWAASHAGLCGGGHDDGGRLAPQPLPGAAGAFFNVSQPTVSRVVRSLAAVVGAAAADGMPGVTDVEQAERLLVDGTLCPTGNRAGEGRQGEGLYSGKRHRAGVNTLVVAYRWGRLLDASESTRGAMHDARSFSEAGLDRILAGRDVLGDLGCGINTPLRKPPDGKLPAFAQINNRAHSQARAAVERTIALLKQWRGLSGGYRGPLARFPVTLRTVVALEKFRIYETPF